ncbi:hypothetical protein BH11MYX3_BH11MYX3_19820 [soil metagenome]
MTPVALDVFFAEMAELLAGRRTPAQCEAVLGPSSSGTARLGIYTKLVERQQQGAIESLYRATLVAAGSWNRARTDELRARYLREAPPAHWSPTVVAAPFADYLEAHGAPADVVELADYARTRHDVLRAPDSEGIAGLAVRHYTYGVHEFTGAVERGERTSGRPEARSSTWLFGRHRTTAKLVMIVPSLAMLVALQLVEERAWCADLPPVTRSDVAAAASILADQLLLSEVALGHLRALL